MEKKADQKKCIGQSSIPQAPSRCAGPNEPAPHREPKREHRPRGERLDPCRAKPATPYLIIRSFPDDLGVRPVPPVDASSLYFSPDIGVGIHAPIVEVYVNNAGLLSAAPVQVELYRGSPSLTYPSPDLALVGTQYTLIQPQSSSRLLFDLQPFPFEVIGSLVARASTPFDTCAATFDPLLDRHVAIQNIGAPDPGAPPAPVDLSIPNWFTAPTSTSVEMVIERLQLTRPYPASTGAANERNLFDDLVRFGESQPDLTLHLDQTQPARRSERKSLHRLRRAICQCTPAHCLPPGLRRSTANPLPSPLSIDLEMLPDSRRLYPTTSALKSRSEHCPGAGAESVSRLPPYRQLLIPHLELEPLQERKLRLHFRSATGLRADEFMVLHLFHINKEPKALLGRFSLILAAPP